MPSSTSTSAAVLGYGALDRELLTRSLLGLARRAGVENVTMRGLAAEAGTAASSVYYHVKNKDELLDLLIEAVVSTIAVPREGSWEERLLVLYANAWSALIAVPGIAALLQQRPHTVAAAQMDRQTRAILRESPFPAADLGAAHAVLYIHLLGAVELQHRLHWTNTVTAAPNVQEVFSYGLRVILAGLEQVSGVGRWPARRAKEHRR